LITDWKKRGALRSLLFFVPLALRLEIRDFERNVLMKKGKSITSLKAVILVLFLFVVESIENALLYVKEI
jgi:hypothetical protein